MTADYTTVPLMFGECNRKYFNGSLPKPKFTIISKLNIIARFEYNKDKKGKHPIKWQELKVSDCYEYTEQELREIIVHEMIHYYIAWNGIKDNKDHGREFMKIANELNEKYGLNITKTKDVSSLIRTDKTPQRSGLMKILLG